MKNVHEMTLVELVTALAEHDASERLLADDGDLTAATAKHQVTQA